MSIKIKYQDEIHTFKDEAAVEIYFDEKIRQILLEEAEQAKKEYLEDNRNNYTKFYLEK